MRTSSASSLMSSDRENHAIPRITTTSRGGGISASSSSSTIVGIAATREPASSAPGLPSRSVLPPRGLARPSVGISKSTGSQGRSALAPGAGQATIRVDKKLSPSSPSAARRYSIAPSSASVNGVAGGTSAIPSPVKSTLVSPAKRMSLSTNPGGRLPLRSIQLPSSSSSSSISALGGGGGAGRKLLGDSTIGGAGGEGK